MHVFRSNFRHEYKKKILEHLLSFPCPTKFDKRRNAETLVNSVEFLFWALKTAKLIRFSRYQIGILHTFSSTSDLLYVFRIFENSKRFLKHFGNKQSDDYFPQISKFSEMSKSNTAISKLCSLFLFFFNQSVLSLKLCS